MSGSRADWVALLIWALDEINFQECTCRATYHILEDVGSHGIRHTADSMKSGTRPIGGAVFSLLS